MTYFWNSPVMVGESILPIRADDRTATANRLLFPVMQILSVTSSSGRVTYAPDQDYVFTPGSQVNHPNDFGHRVYAQVLSALLIREPN